MVLSIPTSQTPIQQVVERILSSHKISRQDQEILLTLITSSSLSEIDKLLVQEVHTLLNKGFIKVLD